MALEYFRDGEWHSFPLEVVPPVAHSVHDWYDGAVREEKNPQRAAENWIERYEGENCEYYVLGGGTEILPVRDTKTGKVTLWELTGATIPQYTARQITPEQYAELSVWEKERSEGWDRDMVGETPLSPGR